MYEVISKDVPKSIINTISAALAVVFNNCTENSKITPLFKSDGTTQHPTSYKPILGSFGRKGKLSVTLIFHCTFIIYSVVY